MQVKVIKRATIPWVPSASGVEIINGIIYVIGDDASSLFVLDHSLKNLANVELYKAPEVVDGRIPKAKKADFECMTRIVINGNDHLLIMGSGSAKGRDRAFLVKLPTRFNKKYIVKEVNVSSLYALLAGNSEIAENSMLNLEAAATSDEHLLLFNRANLSGKNLILYFTLEEFIPFIDEDSGIVPFPKIIPCEIPKINGLSAGFTGACVYEDLIFFTCAAEDTSDPVLDGKVEGSMIGCKPIDRIKYLKGESSVKSASPEFAVIKDESGNVLPIKVESISVYEKDEPSTYIALAVTDDDQGGSELLMLEICLSN